jgi:putative ABC transport system permease protein
MGTLLQDLRYAARFFRKSPLFSFAAVATLALGIGANAAIFTVVNGVLLNPLPLPEPDRLAFITRDGDVSIPDGRDWRARSRSFESISLFLRNWSFDSTGQGEPERLNGSVADSELFRVLRVKPALGRFYGPKDDRPEGERVAVLGWGFWQRRFGGDRGVIGRVLRLSDHPVTVIGVAPPEADFLRDGIDLWMPPAVETPWALEERGTNNFDAIGRLRPGVSVAKAREEMVAISMDLARAYPKTNARKIVEPIGLLDFMVAGIRPALYVLLAAVGLVLLLGAANLASLLLARAAVRRPEIALRLAIGASPARILRQLVTEGLLLSTIGGVLGLALAWTGKDLLLAIAPGALPRAADVALDGRVVLFALLLSAATGVLFGLAPAFRLTGTDPAAALAAGGRVSGGPARHRLLGFVAASEVALASLLLVGAGLLLTSFVRLMGAPLGFKPDHVITARLVLPESRYSSRPDQTRAFTSIVDRVGTIPGVVSAASVIGAPLERGGIGGPLLFEGRAEADPTTPRPGGRAGLVGRPSARSRPVVGDYFQTMRLPIVKGRAFTSADREDSVAVAVVNRRFVARYFGSENPLGRRISWQGWSPELAKAPKWMTIVGIAEDVRTADITEPDEVAVYAPYSQRPADWQRFGTILARTSGDPALVGRRLREAVWAFDPSLTVADVVTLEERRSTVLASRRFTSLLLAVFGGAALLLALQGIVGVLSYMVGERRREIGIRIALGASPRDVFAAVLGQAAKMTFAGLAVGILAAVALTRLIAGLLYGVEPNDPATFASAAILVLAAALGACLVPARNAMRTDPMEAIRTD